MEYDGSHIAINATKAARVEQLSSQHIRVGRVREITTKLDDFLVLSR